MLCACVRKTLRHALGLQFDSTCGEPLIETRSLSLDSMMAYLFASLLPASLQQDGGQRYGTTQHAFTLANRMAASLPWCAVARVRDTEVRVEVHKVRVYNCTMRTCAEFTCVNFSDFNIVQIARNIKGHGILMALKGMAHFLGGLFRSCNQYSPCKHFQACAGTVSSLLYLVFAYVLTQSPVKALTLIREQVLRSINLAEMNGLPAPWP